MMIRSHREALRTAIEAGAVPAAIDALVGIAQSLVDEDDKERAAEILALVLLYPMNREAREVAEAMFDELEAELCPRVMMDAQALAEVMTLDDLATEEIRKIER
jgi:hypothetical protein